MDRLNCILLLLLSTSATTMSEKKHLHCIEDVFFPPSDQCTLHNLEGNAKTEWTYGPSSDVPCSHYLKPPNVVRVTIASSQLDEVPRGLFLNFGNAKIFTMYRSGLKEIDLYAFEGGDKLQTINFPWNELKVVPNMVFADTPAVSAIDLNHNKIEEVEPEAFYGLKNLKSVDLSNNQLEFLDLYVFYLTPELEFLSLKNNKFTTLDEDLFIRNLKLKDLDLSGNGLNQISSSLFKNQPDLCSLDLAHNKFTQFNTGEISAGKLVLSDNELTQLFIGGNVKRLEAENNQISEVQCPANLKMTELSLRNNSLKNLNCVPKLTAVEKLDLSLNPIGKIKEKDFGNLENLLELELESSQINGVESSALKGSRKARSINFHDNNLKNLDLNTFKVSPDLETLTLDKNLLTEIDYETFMKDHPKLKQFGISENKWTCDYLDEMIRTIKSESVKIPVKYPSKSGSNVDLISCKDTGATRKPITEPTITKEEAYKVFNYKDGVIKPKQPINDIPDGALSYFNGAKTLSASKSGIKTITPEDFYGATTLLDLEMSENELEKLPNLGFSEASSLTSLDISSNSINEIEDQAFYGLTQLKKLDVSSNKVKRMAPTTFYPMPEIEELDFDENEIEILENGLFQENPKLKQISFAKNQISKIEGSPFKNIPELEILNLAFNKLDTMSTRDINAKSLNVQNNDMKKLYLTSSIDKLEAQNNRISTMICPSSLTTQELNIANNSLVDFTCISWLKSLRDLDLSMNNLDGALNPNLFKYLKALTTLKMSQSHLKSIPKDLFIHQKNLNSIDLSENELSDLNTDIFEPLQEIQNLWLDGNDLAEIDVSLLLQKVVDGSKVGLSNNPWDCSALDQIVRDLKKQSVTIPIDNPVTDGPNVDGIACDGPILQPKSDALTQSKPVEKSKNNIFFNYHLQCDENEFNPMTDICTFSNMKTDPYVVWTYEPTPDTNRTNNINAKAIKTAIFKDATLKEVPKGMFDYYPNVDTLIAKGVGVKSIYSYTLKNARNLKKLDLSENTMTKVTSKVFMDTVNLEELNLSSNKIKYIQEGAFTGLTNLRILDLSQNGYSLPKKADFKLLPNLEDLNLSSNNIEQIDTDLFDNNPKLTSIDLSKNHLKTINMAAFKNLPNLKTLILDNNDLSSINVDELPIGLRELSITNNQFTCEYLETLSQALAIRSIRLISSLPDIDGPKPGVIKCLPEGSITSSKRKSTSGSSSSKDEVDLTYEIKKNVTTTVIQEEDSPIYRIPVPSGNYSSYNITQITQDIIPHLRRLGPSSKSFNYTHTQTSGPGIVQQPAGKSEIHETTIIKTQPGQPQTIVPSGEETYTYVEEKIEEPEMPQVIQTGGSNIVRNFTTISKTTKQETPKVSGYNYTVVEETHPRKFEDIPSGSHTRDFTQIIENLGPEFKKPVGGSSVINYTYIEEGGEQPVIQQIESSKIIRNFTTITKSTKQGVPQVVPTGETSIINYTYFEEDSEPRAIPQFSGGSTVIKNFTTIRKTEPKMVQPSGGSTIVNYTYIQEGGEQPVIQQVGGTNVIRNFTTITKTSKQDSPEQLVLIPSGGTTFSRNRTTVIKSGTKLGQNYSFSEVLPDFNQPDHSFNIDGFPDIPEDDLDGNEIPSGGSSFYQNFTTIRKTLPQIVQPSGGSTIVNYTYIQEGDDHPVIQQIGGSKIIRNFTTITKSTKQGVPQVVPTGETSFINYTYFEEDSEPKSIPQFSGGSTVIRNFTTIRKTEPKVVQPSGGSTIVNYTYIQEGGEQPVIQQIGGTKVIRNFTTITKTSKQDVPEQLVLIPSGGTTFSRNRTTVIKSGTKLGQNYSFSEVLPDFNQPDHSFNIDGFPDIPEDDLDGNEIPSGGSSFYQNFTTIRKTLPQIVQPSGGSTIVNYTYIQEGGEQPLIQQAGGTKIVRNFTTVTKTTKQDTPKVSGYNYTVVEENHPTQFEDIPSGSHTQDFTQILKTFGPESITPDEGSSITNYTYIEEGGEQPVIQKIGGSKIIRNFTTVTQTTKQGAPQVVPTGETSFINYTYFEEDNEPRPIPFISGGSTIIKNFTTIRKTEPKMVQPSGGSTIVNYTYIQEGDDQPVIQQIGGSKIIRNFTTITKSTKQGAPQVVPTGETSFINYTYFEEDSEPRSIPQFSGGSTVIRNFTTIRKTEPKVVQPSGGSTIVNYTYIQEGGEQPAIQQVGGTKVIRNFTTITKTSKQDAPEQLVLVPSGGTTFSRNRTTVIKSSTKPGQNYSFSEVMPDFNQPDHSFSIAGFPDIPEDDLDGNEIPSGGSSFYQNFTTIRKTLPQIVQPSGDSTIVNYTYIQEGDDHPVIQQIGGSKIIRNFTTITKSTKQGAPPVVPTGEASFINYTYFEEDSEPRSIPQFSGGSTVIRNFTTIRKTEPKVVQPSGGSTIVNYTYIQEGGEQPIIQQIGGSKIIRNFTTVTKTTKQGSPQVIPTGGTSFVNYTYFEEDSEPRSIPQVSGGSILIRNTTTIRKTVPKVVQPSGGSTIVNYTYIQEGGQQPVIQQVGGTKTIRNFTTIVKESQPAPKPISGTKTIIQETTGTGSKPLGGGTRTIDQTVVQKSKPTAPQKPSSLFTKEELSPGYIQRPVPEKLIDASSLNYSMSEIKPDFAGSGPEFTIPGQTMSGGKQMSSVKNQTTLKSSEYIVIGQEKDSLQIPAGIFTVPDAVDGSKVYINDTKISTTGPVSQPGVSITVEKVSKGANATKSSTSTQKLTGAKVSTTECPTVQTAQKTQIGQGGVQMGKESCCSTCCDELKDEINRLKNKFQQLEQQMRGLLERTTNATDAMLDQKVGTMTVSLESMVKQMISEYKIKGLR